MATGRQGFGCEHLEDRRMLAAYVDGEILVQFADHGTHVQEPSAGSAATARAWLA